MSQDRKKSLAPAINAILKKYGLKGSLSVRHHSTLVLTIRSGKLNIIGNFNDNIKKSEVMARDNYLQVNPYWAQDHFSGEVKECMVALVKAMNDGNFNDSDPMTDYHSVGWYIDINVGKYDKPYVVTK